MIPYSQFSRDNSALMGFLFRYPSFCIRAIPDTQELPRRFKIGVKSFEDCQEFLREHVLPEKKDSYTVLITEYGQEKPANLSGIVISREHDALIEVGECGLDELSHGEKIIPVSGEFAFHGGNHFRSMRYNTKDAEKRELMWRALQYLRRDLPSDSDNFPNFDFMKGYFEFVVVEEDQIRFLDYKVNEMYLR